MNPFLFAGCGCVLRGMTEVTPAGRRFAHDVEKHLVVGVEPAFVVGGPDLVLGFGIVKLVQLGGVSLHGGQATGDRGRPTIILAGRLQGGPALVLPGIGMVTGEAVDLVLAGNRPAQEFLRVGVLIVVGRLHFAVVPAGIMAAEPLEKFPGGEFQLFGSVRALPFAVGHGDLASCPRVGQHPRLPVPAGRRAGAARVKMPADGDLVVVVAFATGLAHRHRSGLLIRSFDGNTFFIVKRNQVGDCSTVSVVAIPEALTRFSRTRGHQPPGKQYPENRYPNGTNLQWVRYG